MPPSALRPAKKKKERHPYPCPYKKCNSNDTDVLHTYPRWRRSQYTKRRHLCNACGRRFNTLQLEEGSWRALVELTRPGNSATGSRVDGLAERK